MPIEYALTQIDTRLVRLPDPPANLTLRPRAWWPLTKLVLAGIMLIYLVEIVQDVQRVRGLRAEPTSLAKTIITKNEAWQRIHGRPMAFATSGLRAPTATRDTRRP